jgi:hypothetical protein
VDGDVRSVTTTVFMFVGDAMFRTFFVEFEAGLMIAKVDMVLLAILRILLL